MGLDVTDTTLAIGNGIHKSTSGQPDNAGTPEKADSPAETDRLESPAVPPVFPVPTIVPAGSTDYVPAAGTSPPPKTRAWKYVSAGRRDLRLDFLRGYCAFAMVIDHIGGASWLYPLTGGNQFFVSAAEGFIFLSGLLVGLVYGPRIRRDGLGSVQLHLLRRSLTLYGVTLGLTFTFVGLSRLAGMPWLQDSGPLTAELVVSIITLHHTYYLVDVMLLYTLVLAIAPLALLLLHSGHTWAVLALSVGFWGLFQRFPAESAIPWPIVNNDTFLITAWQLWFFGGMIIGYHRPFIWKWLARLPRIPVTLALVTAAVALIVLRMSNGPPLAGLFGSTTSQEALDTLFHKEYVRPARLLAFAVFFPLLYLVLTYCWRPLERVLGWLMIPFGANALYVYAMHLFAVYFSALLLPYITGFNRFDPLMNTPVQIAAILLIWLLVKREVLFEVVPR